MKTDETVRLRTELCSPASKLTDEPGDRHVADDDIALLQLIMPDLSLELIGRIVRASESTS